MFDSCPSSLVHGTPPTPVSFRNKPRYFYDLERGASK